jgi:hypothetical protein
MISNSEKFIEKIRPGVRADGVNPVTQRKADEIDNGQDVDRMFGIVTDATLWNV